LAFLFFKGGVMNNIVKYLLLFTLIFYSSTLYSHDTEKVTVIPLKSCNDPAILPENICVGIAICGVAGTKLCTSPTYGTVTSADNRVWLDRNLGASRVATSLTDSQAYGDLYQWGRLTDGHESRTSLTDPTLSTTDVPGHGSFILGTSTGSPFDWRSPQNDNLWQGVSGINNPCPAGFRLPTSAEWETERLSWSSNNAAGAYASPLKLVLAGYRSYNGTLSSVGNAGYYWSSTVDEIYSDILDISASLAYGYREQRYWGFSVRCIKD